jgi:hypothetical protein
VVYISSVTGLRCTWFRYEKKKSGVLLSWRVFFRLCYVVSHTSHGLYTIVSSVLHRCLLSLSFFLSLSLFLFLSLYLYLSISLSLSLYVCMSVSREQPPTRLLCSLRWWRRALASRTSSQQCSSPFRPLSSLWMSTVSWSGAPTQTHHRCCVASGLENAVLCHQVGSWCCSDPCSFL